MSVPAVSPVGQAASAQPAGTRTSEAEAAKAAKAFERVMLEQLTKELASSAAPEDAEGGASAGTKAYRDMLPGAMADALSQSGGIGIAAQLQATMTAAKATTPASAASTASDAPSGAAGGGAVPNGVAS